jgi:hypothetical protein
VAYRAESTNQRKAAQHRAGTVTAFLSSTLLVLQTKKFAREDKRFSTLSRLSAYLYRPIQYYGGS